jgi:hypothetical protein
MILIFMGFICNVNLQKLMDFFWHDVFLFKDKRLYVSNYSMYELLVRETYDDRLI